MSIAPQPSPPYRQRRPSRAANSGKVRKFPRTPPGGKVERLPIKKSPPSPFWRSLLWLQRGSSVLAFTLVSLTLIVYAGTVYTQQLWSKEYKKLQYLQSMERQLVKALTSMENYHAQQAEQPNSGLEHSRPLVLNPASETMLPSTAEVSPEEEKEVAKPEAPLGY